MVISAAHNYTNTYTEKRHCPRWAVVSRIFYQLNGDTTIHESQSVNISATGICFTTPELLSENTRIKMNIFISGERVLPVGGQVIWSKSENGRHQAAIRFSDISSRSQEMILEHAFEMKKEDMVNYWFQGWNR
jgi:c-di-GMP-binding flagellar brake protein YcgR